MWQVDAMLQLIGLGVGDVAGPPHVRLHEVIVGTGEWNGVAADDDARPNARPRKISSCRVECILQT